MKVVCAWCEKEGVPSLLAFWPPEDDLRVSHGICETHAALYRETIFSEKKTRLSPKLRKRIAVRAYSLYEARGYHQGDDLQDWLDAEREILNRPKQVCSRETRG
ncbi:MAG: DUF2934 domain-containing protein [Nitrospira sp.]|nr:DUF2934 domain-containing protein [Nitrospira sp.]